MNGDGGSFNGDHPLAGVVTGVIAALIERGRELEAESAAKHQRELDEWRTKVTTSTRESLADTLRVRLGVTVRVDDMRVEVADNESRRHGIDFRSIIEIEGYQFSLGFSTVHASNNGTYGLQIACSCVKGCGKPLWVQLQGWDGAERELARILEEPQQHQWPCLQQFNDDGEPTTDYNGHPLPPPKPRVPTAAERYQFATDVYSNLVKLRRELQFAKAIEKEEAIARVLASGVAKSATGAEKLVETDKQYAALCRTLTETIVSEIRAKETMIAARPHSQHEPVGGPEDAP